MTYEEAKAQALCSDKVLCKKATGGTDLHACVSVLDNLQEVKVKGSKKFSSFVEFSEWEKMHLKEALPTVYTMKATGVYHENLCHFLYERGAHISVVGESRVGKI